MNQLAAVRHELLALERLWWRSTHPMSADVRIQRVWAALRAVEVGCREGWLTTTTAEYLHANEALSALLHVNFLEPVPVRKLAIAQARTVRAHWHMFSTMYPPPKEELTWAQPTSTPTRRRAECTSTRAARGW